MERFRLTFSFSSLTWNNILVSGFRVSFTQSTIISQVALSQSFAPARPEEVYSREFKLEERYCVAYFEYFQRNNSSDVDTLQNIKMIIY